MANRPPADDAVSFRLAALKARLGGREVQARQLACRPPQARHWHTITRKPCQMWPARQLHLQLMQLKSKAFLGACRPSGGSVPPLTAQATSSCTAQQWYTSSVIPADAPHCISCRSCRLGAQPAAARASASAVYTSLRCRSHPPNRINPRRTHVCCGDAGMHWNMSLMAACINYTSLCLSRQDGSLPRSHSATRATSIALGTPTALQTCRSTARRCRAAGAP